MSKLSISLLKGSQHLIHLCLTGIDPCSPQTITLLAAQRSEMICYVCFESTNTLIRIHAFIFSVPGWTVPLLSLYGAYPPLITHVLHLIWLNAWDRSKGTDGFLLPLHDLNAC
jgi:hypothetical protein